MFVKEIPIEKAEKLAIDYIKKNKKIGDYLDALELAEVLGIPYELAHEIFLKLCEKGYLRLRKMKPKPLDLEGIIEELKKERFIVEDNFIETEEKLLQAIETVQKRFYITEKQVIEIILDKVKQRIKQACEFWLRYKDNPGLFLQDFPEYKKELERIEKWAHKNEEGIEGFWERYNEWLFRLAFRDGEV